MDHPSDEITAARRPAATARPLLARLAGNGSVASVAEVVVNGFLQLLAFRVVIGATSLAIFGVWALVQSLTSLVRLADLGVAGALPKHIGELGDAERRENGWRLIDTALVFNAVFYAGLALLTYWPLRVAVAGSLSGTQAALARSVLPFVLMNAVLWSLSSVPTAALVGLRRGTAKSVISMSGSAMLLVAASALAPRYQLHGLVLAQSCQMLLVSIAGWAALSRTMGEPGFRFRLRFDRSVVRETVGLSLKMQANTAMAQFHDVLIRLVLTSQAGPAAGGLYELVERVMQPVRVVLLAPLSLGLPILARAFAKGRLLAVNRIYERQFLLTAAATALVFPAALAAAPIVETLLLDGDNPLFFRLFLIDWIMMAAYVLCFPAMLLGPASGRLSINLAANAVMLAITATAATLLASRVGPAAGLAAAGASLVSMSVATAVLNCRRFGASVLPRSAAIRPLLRRGGLRRLLAPVMG